MTYQGFLYKWGLLIPESMRAKFEEDFLSIVIIKSPILPKQENWEDDKA